MDQPRGIRNNNPGNIRWGDPWQGLVAADKKTDESFCQFTAPSWGVRAIARVLVSYFDKYGLKTVQEVINRWAPDSENDTQSYINSVCQACNIQADQELDLHTYEDMNPLVQAIIRHENGNGTLSTTNTWYPQATIDEGLRLAGIKPVPKVGPGGVPATKESAGALSLAGVGAAQLAAVAPQALAAIKDAQDSLTSGDVVKIVFGVVTVAIAVFIAWSQFAKNRQGQL